MEQIGQDEEKLKEAYEYYDAQFKYGINLSFNPRGIVGDDVDNVNDKDYGICYVFVSLVSFWYTSKNPGYTLKSDAGNFALICFTASRTLVE